MAEEVKKEDANSECLSGTFDIENKKAIVHNAICNKCKSNGWVRSMDHNHIQQGEHLNSRFFRTVQGIFCEKCCPVKG